jgi:predicted HTH transcriptional regulator
MDDLTSEALNAEGETGEVEFKETFDTSSTGAWCEIIKDIVAIANSGGGVIVFGLDDDGNPSGEDIQDVSDLDPAKISDKITKYTDVQFSEFRLYERKVEGEDVVALRIERSNIPMVFTSPGNYPVGDGRQKTTFSSGAEMTPISVPG